MKKITMMLLALGMTAGALTSCQKEEQSGMKFTGRMESCTDIRNPKTVLDGNMLKWVNGDQIMVYADNAAIGGEYSADVETPATTTTFSFASGMEQEGSYYYAVYPADIAMAGARIDLPSTQVSPDGSLTGFPMAAMSAGSTEFEFKNLCGVLKLHLQAANKTVTSIALSVDEADTAINGRFAAVELRLYPDITPGTHTTTLELETPQDITNGHEFYIYLPAGQHSGLTIEITASDGSVCTKGPATQDVEIVRSKYTTITLGNNDLEFTGGLPEGALPGLFSVSATKQVHFAQGNLQYQASTGTWRFAEHQYDYIGSANSNISTTNSGWIDLFGWGTGNNPTLATEDNRNYSTFVDWGVNAIAGGGNATNLWRTLTDAEWDYLINTRANASDKKATGSVDGVNGLILLPDSWAQPSDCTFRSGFASSGSDWSRNSYTLSQWAAMEAAGAVFLPAAGSREGTNVGGVNNAGHYWSTTRDGEHYAYYMLFYGNNALTFFSDNCHMGLSVRLVRESH